MIVRFQDMYESGSTHIERQSLLCKTKTGMETRDWFNTSPNISEISRVIMKKRLPYQETPTLQSKENGSTKLDPRGYD